MDALGQLLLIAHVLGAAVAFGGNLFLPRQLRDALSSERTSARLQLSTLQRVAAATGGAALLVVLTGVLLALRFPGGFGGLPVRFHIALTLSIVWLGLGFAGVGGTLRRAARVVESDAALGDAQPLARRVAMFAGMQHLLFTAVLVLMLWRL